MSKRKKRKEIRVTNDMIIQGAKILALFAFTVLYLATEDDGKTR